MQAHKLVTIRGGGGGGQRIENFKSVTGSYFPGDYKSLGVKVPCEKKADT